MIDRCRALLRAFTGLELLEAHGTAFDALDVSFGPGGELSLYVDQCDVRVATADGTSRWFRRDDVRSFPDERLDAVVEALNELGGLRVEALEHGRDHRLVVRFAGGAAFELAPCEVDEDVDWWIDVVRGDRRLEAGPFNAAERRPARQLRAFDGERLTALAYGPLTGDRDAAGAAGILGALRGLAIAGSEWDVLRLGTGRDTVQLRIGAAGVTVDGVRVREVSEPIPWVDLEAGLAPLTGRVVCDARVDDHGLLRVAFDDGGALDLEPDVEPETRWQAQDAGAREVVEALGDGRLVATSWDFHAPPPEAGVWGSLGVLRPVPHRPARPPGPPRPAPRSVVSGILGGLAGRSFATVDLPADDDAALVLDLDPSARVVLETCALVVCDGDARVRHHRDGSGRWLGRDERDGRARAAAALRAHTGARIDRVALEDGTVLTLALSDGAVIALEPERWDVHDWRLLDHRHGGVLESVPEQALGGPDGRVARLRWHGAWAVAGTVTGALGAVRAQDAGRDGARSLDADSVVAARALLAAPLGLALREVRRRSLELGDERTGIAVVPRWGEVWLDGRPLPRDDVDAALAPLLGRRVTTVEHREPGWLLLGFEGGRRVGFAPCEPFVVASWSAALDPHGPWIAATDDGAVRTMAPDVDHAARPATFLYGSLGTLPAYGFKS